MPARTRMTMRAYIQRNTASANALGHESVPSWTALSTTPCYAWVDRGDTRHTAEMSAEGERYRAIVPIGTDVTSKDRLEKVTERDDTQLFGVMYVDAVIRRRDHLELRLRSHE